MTIARPRDLLAELLGSALLAATVVGSGIAAARLSPGDPGLQLLENAFATALGLGVLILVFQPISGAHFNPIVTLSDCLLRTRPWRDAARYLPAQVAGCIAGAILANLMFDLTPVSWSTTERISPSTFAAEILASAGLILVIFALARTGRSALAAPAVAAYIGAAYWFTSSTSFANPALTVGRVFSDTFAGISPLSALWFVLAQLIGAGVGVLLVMALLPRVTATGTASAPSV